MTSPLRKRRQTSLGYDLSQLSRCFVLVITNRQELSMPPTIELKQALGFSLWMAKAVLNGRGDEIIDLAKTNFFR